MAIYAISVAAYAPNVVNVLRNLCAWEAICSYRSRFPALIPWPKCVPKSMIFEARSQCGNISRQCGICSLCDKSNTKPSRAQAHLLLLVPFAGFDTLAKMHPNLNEPGSQCGNIWSVWQHMHPMFEFTNKCLCAQGHLLLLVLFPGFDTLANVAIYKASVQHMQPRL